jgi:hypothetical protein
MYSARVNISRVTALALALVACDSATSAPKPPPKDTLLPGEVCDHDNSAPIRIRFDPPSLVLSPDQSRPVHVSVDPDVCEASELSFSIANDALATSPAAATLDLRHATYDFSVKAKAKGKTELVAKFKRYDGVEAEERLAIDVRDGAPPTCATGDEPKTQHIDDKTPTMSGAGSLANASLSIPAAAFTRNDWMGMPAFDAELGCSPDLTQEAAGQPLRLGPAVSFIAKDPKLMNQSQKREIDFSIPINPAAFPTFARLRHLQVLFRSPRAKKARAITITNPRIDKVGDDYVLRFASPWFGTYQAAVAPDAGTHTRRRHLTHRALLGFSMGAIGGASVGLRHHDKFDVVATFGGPNNWTWLLWYIENYALGGFCPASNPNCTKPAKPSDYPLPEVFAHTMDFNHWWYEKGNGNGGRFPRSEYIQLLEDISLALGNPNGEGDRKKGWQPFLAPGLTLDDKFVKGDTAGLPAGTNCAYTVDPIGGDPREDTQKLIERQCKRSRCDPANAKIFPSGYYNWEYNPDGTQQVISVCDGAETGDSPYMDSWRQPTADEAKPANMILAVDLNKNGIRDENEPIIRAGHEQWDDCGSDGLCNAQEPGYDPVDNPDPNQDDYDFQVNPNGTEGDHRYQLGEPFRDYGLDGVPNTKDLHVAGDVGEGDGQFTIAEGLRNFYENDSYSIIRKWSTNIPGGPLTDEALQRLDIISDGGIRDIFNLGSCSNHLTGAIASRQRPDGTQLRSTVFYSGFDYLPGQVAGKPNDYIAGDVRWADVMEMPNIRYGNPDATSVDIDRGDGMHVGTGAQVLYRLQTGFYYIGQRWTHADRLLTKLTNEVPDEVETTTINELGTACEIAGKCEKMFTGPKTGRTGPIGITLPPGYALKANQERDVRYPVLFVLHGYGQDPRDLEALAIITNNFMNKRELSYANRLPKFIVVYMDGRCRERDDRPECIRGTFYMNSMRPDGVQLDDWFMEVIDYIDKNYRTLPPTDVDWVE